MNNALSEFRSAIQGAGLNPPDAVIDDGKLHRFASNGNPHDLAGWYCFHGDGIPAGAFGDWRSGAAQTWRSDIGRALSHAEEAAHRQKVDAMRRLREEEELRRQADAACKANAMWEQADGASDEHPYLQAKKVRAYGLRTYAGELMIGGMACAGCLIVPMKIGKVLHSLQFIAPNGEKRFLPGGRVRGCYYSIGAGESLKKHGVLCLAEGYATAASIHAATGYGVIAAFNAGNLEPVAVTMARLRNEYPQLRFIVCADDDAWTAGNPGITKATEAAKAIGGILAIPDFGENRPEATTDFNDLSRCQGQEAVMQCIESAGQVPKLKIEPVAALHVEPVSLDAAMLPALPVDCLPAWFRDMTLAVSEATETPIELAAMMGFAVLGTCCQKTFIISPTPGYVEPLNIWTVAALDSGNRKTAVMGAMTAPLLEWQREQQETARQRIVSAQSDQETIKARIKELRAKASRNEDIEDFEKAKKEIQALEQSLEEVPASPRLWAEDVTPERLGQLMAEQGERLSLLSDEGGIFDLMAGRYSAGIPNIDIFLKAHAGSPVCVDRGSRPTVMMQHPALTIGLSPQPEVLRGLAEKPGFRGRGLLARFLYALPDSRLGRRGLDPRPVPETVAIRYRAAIYALLELKPQIEGDGYKPHTLHLADDAHRAWNAFQKAVEPELLEGGQFENMKDWAGKLPGAAIRLAGLLHCAEHAHRSPAEIHISLSTMTQALDLGNVLAEHALVAFDLIGSDPVMDAARKLWKWIERTQTKEPSARDCFQALKGTYRRMADLEPAFDVLVERFYLFEAPRPEGRPSPGRPSRRFSVNPILVKRWS